MGRLRDRGIVGGERHDRVGAAEPGSELSAGHGHVDTGEQHPLRLRFAELVPAADGEAEGLRCELDALAVRIAIRPEELVIAHIVGPAGEVDLFGAEAFFGEEHHRQRVLEGENRRDDDGDAAALQLLGCDTNRFRGAAAPCPTRARAMRFS